MNGIDQNIITQSLAAGYVAKVVVDLFKARVTMKDWQPPVLALVVGILAAFLLRIAGGEVLTGQLAAQCILAGVLAAAGAVGSTELQKNTKPTEG